MKVSRWYVFESACILFVTFENWITFYLVHQNLDLISDENSLEMMKSKIVML